VANTSGKKVTDYAACTAPEANASLLMVGNTAGVNTSYRLTISTLFGNNQVNVIAKYVQSPANNTTVQEGTILYDGNYLYIAVANNQLKRIGLSDYT
jgi:hypothetical protein